MRRPLADTERASFLALYAGKERASGHARAVQLVIQAMLQSPSFLYRLEAPEDEDGRPRGLDGFEVATRLAYFVWATGPDDALLDDAAAGRLDTIEGVAAATRRMLRDPRTVDGVRNFYRQWLSLRELETASKDQGQYPTFGPELRDAMVEETLRFASGVTFAGEDVVTALFTSPRSYVNPVLARHYGMRPPRGEDFVLTELPAGQRAGILTHASLLTVLAHSEDAAPIHRGKFVRERLLCHVVPPPPANVVIALPTFDPNETKRARFARHRSERSCAGCHAKMDPIGFGFENYDGVGAFRTRDGAFPVDATGELTGTRNADGPFDGAVALGKRLAVSEEVRRCFATHWFRAGIGRVEGPDDATELDRIYAAFHDAGFDARELLVAVASSDAFRGVVRGAKEGHP